MSKIALEPNASGTGTFTIASPNSNTSRTLTLPDADGALLNDASSLDASNLTGALPAIDGSALTGIDTGAPVRAWVSLSMSGSSINDSYNVSSLSDNGIGDFSMHFSSNMGNTNYTHVSGCSHASVLGAICTLEGVDGVAVASNYQTGLFRMNSVYANNAVARTNFDIDRANVSINGDLA